MRGAREARFESLLAEHGAGVATVCRSILRSDDLARDAAQETFVRLWERIEGGDGPANAGPWLRRVALGASLDLARRRKVRAEAELERSLPADRQEPEAASPPARAGGAELEQALERALDELSEGQRSIFLLRHRGGFALREIAEALGVALPTVKTQFARACLKLQARLARFQDEVKS